MASKLQIGRESVKIAATNQLRMISNTINCTLMQININLKKYRPDVFQAYPNAVRFNLRQFCPSMPVFSVFQLSFFFTFVSCYCDITVSSMTSSPAPLTYRVFFSDALTMSCTIRFT